MIMQQDQSDMMGVAFSCRDTWCKERKFPSTQTTVSTLGLASWQDYVLGCDCPSSKVGTMLAEGTPGNEMHANNYIHSIQ